MTLVVICGFVLLSKVSSLEKNILSTLAYYEALGVGCMTPVEIRRYWFGSHDLPSLNALLGGLASMAKRNTVTVKNGYWVLGAGEKKSFEARIRAQKISIQKKHIFTGVARFFPYIPFVRGVALIGSVARENASPASDIDVRIVYAKGWLWTTRLLVTAFTHASGKRRHHTSIRDRLCLNYYVAEGASAQRRGDRPSWHIDAQTLAMWGGDDAAPLASLSFRPRKFGIILTRCAEKALGILGAVWLECLAEYLQRAHITRTLRNSGGGDMRITPHSLTFHMLRNEYVERKYEEIMKLHTV